MKKIAVKTCLATLLWAGSAFNLEGAVHIVQMTANNRFNPSQLTIDFGDTVRWQRAGGSHDIESNLRENGVAFFKSPPPPVSQFEFKFERVGTFSYRCNPHAALGMTGSITVRPAANQPPTVSITSPAEGATFTAPATVTVQTQASDPDGTVAKVDFFSNGNLVGTAATSPFTITLNNVPAGNYSLTATATDNQNATTTSSAVNIVVNPPTANNPPTVAITSPATGLSLAAPGAVTLEATASDSDGSVSEVAFFRAINRGGPSPDCCTLEPLGAVTSAPYKLARSDLQPGFYHIVAQASDNQAAKTLSAEVVFTIHTRIQVHSIVRATGETVIRVKDSISPGPFTLSAQASSDLQNWTDLSDNFASVAGGFLELKDASGLPHRFYRVRAEFQEVQPAN
ncbi:MAG: Ig-like domain-containing protein [Verrucomicrobiales bacterium]|nr:Ig-like domain-containing protein [Verrucomicrobiales bacterium]